MSKTLTGITFIRDGERYDYCYRETIKCLSEFWDEVIVVECGSTDGTIKGFSGIYIDKPNVSIVSLPAIMWEMTKGKEKLNYFQNIAAGLVQTDYQFLLQCDEILHENSYGAVREAMELGHEGYLCRRYNYWGDTNDKILCVDNDRHPCSPVVIRLAKRGYLSYDDGENIGAQADDSLINKIRIHHVGFIRKKEIMKSKVIMMQEEVFGVNHDSKLDGSEIFHPERWFGPDTDLMPVPEPHPKVIQDWIKNRP